ncbi:hypothetical protein AKO1_012517 [Acrasis kona]|uniref:BTB domain-containing protein n=1 Tax=Acrasis kona TaxID=1008807 RepID=A0AAW2YY62_9EUKA
MSSIIREILGDDDDYDEDDYNQYELDEEYLYDNSAPQMSSMTDLIEHTKQSNLPKKKMKPVKVKKIKPKIEYRDVSELIEFQKSLGTFEEKKHKPLSSINYKIEVKECLSSTMSSFPVSKFYLMTPNKKYLKAKNAAFEEAKKKNVNSVDFLEVEALLVDELGTKIPKYEEQQLKNASAYLPYFCRDNYAIATMWDNIYVHGGNASTKDDLMVINTKNNEVRVYSNISILSDVYFRETYNPRDYICHIPHTSHHQMVPYGNSGLVIFGGNSKLNREDNLVYYDYDYTSLQKRLPKPDEMRFYYITVDPNSPDDVMMGVKHDHVDYYKKNKCRYHHLLKSEASSRFPMTLDFTVNQCDNKFILFGGRTGSSPSNELHFVDIDLKQCQVEVKRVKIHKNSIKPPARYNHAAACLPNSNLLIFGGCGVSGLLNDMFIYDDRLKTWKEVELSVNIPPPISNMGSFVNCSNQFLFLYGGVTYNKDMKSNHVLDTIYRFNIGCNEWELIKPLGIVEEQKKVNTHSFNHNCVILNGLVYRLGGINDQSRTVPDLVVMRGAADYGSPVLLIDYLKKQRSSRFMCDVEFKTKDEESAYAHQAIIKVRCPALYQLVMNASHHVFDDLQRPTAIVSFEEYDFCVLDSFLNFLYSGSVELNGLENIERLLDLCQKYAPEEHSALEKICAPIQRIYLDTADEIFCRLQHDLFSLLNDDSTSDITLAIGFDDNVHYVCAHRFILCRSPYFKSMLMSGMQETFSDVINLTDYSIEVMNAILQFIYTDRIVITPSCCVEALLCAHQFGLIEVSSFCRGMASRYMTVDDVVSVLEVAELYTDSFLKNNCLRFIAENYDEIDHFKLGTITSELMSKVMIMREKIIKKRSNKIKNPQQK